MIKDNLLEVLHEMEEVTKLFKLEPFDIYLIPNCNKETLNKIIDEVLNREDLFESKKAEFVKKLETFKERYNV